MKTEARLAAVQATYVIAVTETRLRKLSKILLTGRSGVM